MKSLKPLLASTVFFVTLSSASLFAQDLAQWQGRSVTLQPLPNSSRWVHFHDREDTYTVVLSKSRLFRARKAAEVRVRSVRTRGPDLELELDGGPLGRGAVKFEGVARWSPSTTADMLALLFSGDGIPAKPRFVAHQTSRVLHFRGSNHLPPAAESREFASETDAVAQGYRPCNLCFKWFPGFSGLDVERQIANYQASAVRSWGPPLMEIPAQTRVQEAGRRVLGKWPLPFKGYRYRFTVLDSDVANAAACADGQIYVTSALLDSLETDDELEAVLAHEVGHVEMRHTWRRFRTAQKVSFWSGLAVAVLAGATKSANASDVAASMANFANDLILSGHRRAHEEESDSLAAVYLEGAAGGSTRTGLERGLSKLLYGQQLMGVDPDARGGWFATHPDLPDRILKARTTTTRVLEGLRFDGLNAEGDLVATLSFQMQRYYPARPGAGAGYELIALVDSTPALGQKDRITNMVVDTSAGRIRLDNKEDTELEPGDAVGAVFFSKDQAKLIDDIKGVELKLRNVVRWQRASDGS